MDVVVVALLDAGVVVLPVWWQGEPDVGAVARLRGRQWRLWELVQLLGGAGHMREARARGDPGFV